MPALNSPHLFPTFFFWCSVLLTFFKKSRLVDFAEYLQFIHAQLLFQGQFWIMHFGQDATWIMCSRCITSQGPRCQFAQLLGALFQGAEVLSHFDEVKWEELLVENKFMWKGNMTSPNFWESIPLCSKSPILCSPIWTVGTDCIRGWLSSMNQLFFLFALIQSHYQFILNSLALNWVCYCCWKPGLVSKGEINLLLITVPFSDLKIVKP